MALALPECLAGSLAAGLVNARCIGVSQTIVSGQAPCAGDERWSG